METRVGGVPKDVIGFPELAGTVHMFQGGERAAHDILGRGDDPLNCFPLRYSPATKPHTNTVCYDALYGASVKRHKQIFSQMVLPEYPQEVKSLLCLLY